MAVITKDGKVGKAEEKLVADWKRKIGVAEKFRDADSRKSSWRNMKNFYRGFFKDEIMSVPLVYAYGRQMVPFLYFKNPVVECTPLQRGFGHKAKILEAVDNMLIREMRVKDQLKLIIQDAYLYDYGIRKIGYDSEFAFDETGGMWKDLFEELGIEMTKEESVEYNSFITREFPFFLRVPPRRFCIDPDVEGPTMDTARWCAEEFYRPLQELLDDPRYDTPKDLKPTYMLNKDGSGNYVVSPKTVGEYNDPQTQKKSDTERCKLYEVWDKKEKRRYVVVDGHKGFLVDSDDVWGLDDFFPYDRLCFNPVSDEHYSTSDAQYIEKQQLEYNDVKTQETIHRRKENLKFLVKRNALKPEEKTKFADAKAGVMVEVDCAPGEAPGNVVSTVTSQMSQDIYRVGQDIRQDVTEILALGKNQMSQEMGKRKTASEAMLINQYAELRADERRDLVADFLERSMRDVNHLLFKFWDTPEIIRLIGDEGEEWAEWTGEDLEGEYAVQIVPNSTVPHTKEMYRQKALDLYQRMAGNPFVNLKEITRIVLDSYEEFDTSKILLNQPGEAPSMADFRPGQPKMQDEAGGEGQGSRINMPENAEVAMQNAGQPTGGGEGNE